MRTAQFVAIMLRLLVVVAIMAMALFALPSVARPIAVPVMVLVLVIAPLPGLARLGGSSGWWRWSLIVADVLVLAVAAWHQSSIEVPYLLTHGVGWVQLVILTILVTAPWVTPALRFPVASTVQAPLLAAAYCWGAAAMMHTQLIDLLLPALWIVGQTAISELLFRFIRASARTVDQVSQQRAAAEAWAGVQRARQASEDSHLAALHDTAAATLLMIGLGEVDERSHWLSERLDRDLQALSDPRIFFDLGLMAGVRRVVAESGLQVLLVEHGSGTALPAGVSAAFIGATSEALANVHRHAGVREARIEVRQTPQSVRITVRDAGRGLSPVPVPSPGRGIAHSIIRRIELAGGQARVAAGAGGGVLVELDWSDA